MRTIDLYAGCGGLALGFLKAGYKVVAGFDNWDSAIALHQSNSHLLDHPIYKLDLSQVPKDLSLLTRHSPDIIIGGPPCQDFSSAGKRDESLGRADLTVVFAKTVCSVRPNWFVMENVDRALRSNAYSEARGIFRENGYGLTEVVLDSSFYKVPQRRKRLFLIGELSGEDNGLLPYLERLKSKKAMTVRDYFGDNLGTEYYYRHPWSYKRRAVFSIDEPSPTIRGVNRPIPKGYKGHPGDKAKLNEGVRPLTTKERSLIQTFPEDYVLNNGTKTDVEQMIGNAVPVNLAAAVATAIADYCERGHNKLSDEQFQSSPTFEYFSLYDRQSVAG